jgi:uncharacterized repeat protein (TIGR01451 family)
VFQLSQLLLLTLRLTKAANVTNPAVGETITFEARVINDATLQKATGVQVVDLICQI